MTRQPRLLLISPRFFAYEDDIAVAFERHGFAVTFVDERPSNGSVARAILRLGGGPLRRRIRRHFRSVVETVGTVGWDLVLVIKGEVVPRWFLEAIRRDSPDAVLVYYTFDAVANSTGLHTVLDLFDHRYSFEPDTSVDGLALLYKPLFYGEGYFPLPEGTERSYDIAFVGTLHSNRYRFVRAVAPSFRRAFVHLYVQARWYLAVQRLRDPRLRPVRRDEVRFDRLDRARVADVFRRSIAVLDMQHERQSGLTMRTFEVIASGAYLVTTNPRAAAELGATGRVLTVSTEPTEEEVRGLAATLERLPVPSGRPAGFEQYSVDAWAAEFADLLPEGRRA